jgi:hypothetical protein
MLSKVNKLTTSKFLFGLKAELKKRAFLVVGLFLLTSVMYLGFTISTFERSYEKTGIKTQNFEFLPNAMWLTIITMTTVGYGDIKPLTHMGRFVGVISCLLGMLIVSLMVVSLNVLTDFTQEEKKAYNILKKVTFPLFIF